MIPFFMKFISIREAYRIGSLDLKICLTAHLLDLGWTEEQILKEAPSEGEMGMRYLKKMKPKTCLNIHILHDKSVIAEAI